MPTTTEMEMRKYLERKEDSFDPRDVTPYLNTVFRTMNKTYYIDGEGEMNWEPGMKSKNKVKLIAGLEHSDYYEVQKELDIEDREILFTSMEELIQVMRDYGKPVKEGMHMIILLEPGCAAKDPFMITSMIMKIYPLPDNTEN